MKAMTLRTQLVLLQVVIVLVIVLTVGLSAMLMQERQIREASQERMIAVAQSVAQLPTIIDAYGDPDPAQVIQPIAELIRDSSNVAYVVVTDDEGIRFSHPNPERIGERVSTDPSVPLSGDMYVGTQTGTLGESWRVKVPVFAADGTVMGQVSVGILESDLRADFIGDITGFLLALGVRPSSASSRPPESRASSGGGSTGWSRMRSAGCWRPAKPRCTASERECSLSIPMDASPCATTRRRGYSGSIPRPRPSDVQHPICSTI